jgi:hypothetical protein
MFSILVLGKNLALSVLGAHKDLGRYLLFFSLEKLSNIFLLKGHWKEILTSGFFNDLVFPQPTNCRTSVISNFFAAVVNIFVNSIVIFLNANNYFFLFCLNVRE